MSTFFQKTRKKSYDLFSGYSHYVPGIMGTAGLILLLLAGTLMGSAVVMLFQLFFGNDAAMTYGQLLAYPVMFIPPMAYASFMSRRNELFDTGYALDSNNFMRRCRRCRKALRKSWRIWCLTAPYGYHCCPYQ